jgi:hypothetical protein
LKKCFGCDVGGRESWLVFGNAGESVDSAKLWTRSVKFHCSCWNRYEAKRADAGLDLAADSQGWCER